MTTTATNATAKALYRATTGKKTKAPGPQSYTNENVARGFCLLVRNHLANAPVAPLKAADKQRDDDQLANTARAAGRKRQRSISTSRESTKDLNASDEELERKKAKVADSGPKTGDQPDHYPPLLASSGARQRTKRSFSASMANPRTRILTTISRAQTHVFAAGRLQRSATSSSTSQHTGVVKNDHHGLTLAAILLVSSRANALQKEW